MRKILSILVLSLLVSVFSIGRAQAITVDGTVGDGEWDKYWIYGTDPNEDGSELGEPDIDDNYDISRLYAWWDNADGGDVYIRTDVYSGIPTLASLDPEGVDGAFYEWRIDTDADGVGELRLRLWDSNGAADGGLVVALYRVDNGALLGYGTAGMDDVVEVSFAKNLVPEDLAPARDSDIAMWMKIENDGGDYDDRLPDTTGWLHTVPEPTSMLLLGFGLIGLAGARIRRGFKA